MEPVAGAAVPRPNQRVNRIVGLGALLRDVESAGALDGAPPADGPGPRWRALVSPRTKGFPAYLEPGVRDLVLSLISGWDCLTYSSCEGHPRQDGRPPAPCEVGILPRSEDELSRLLELARAARAAVTSTQVELLCEQAPLTSPVGSHPALQLVFWPRAPFGWDDYFVHLPIAVARAREHVS